MQPWVIMLFLTSKVSLGWQPALPQLMCATRKSPGFIKRMNSGPLVVEQRISPNGICRTGPGIGEAGQLVGLVFVHAGRISAVAVGAADVDRLGKVRIVLILVAFQTAPTFRVGLFFGLGEQVYALHFRRQGKRGLVCAIAVPWGFPTGAGSTARFPVTCRITRCTAFCCVAEVGAKLVPGLLRRLPGPPQIEGRFPRVSSANTRSRPSRAALVQRMRMGILACFIRIRTSLSSHNLRGIGSRRTSLVRPFW